MDEARESLNLSAQRITEIKTIEEGSVTFKTRAEIAQYVEKPLVPACEHFWDIGIKTLMSSANMSDVGGNAYIDLDYNSLSEENIKIAERLSGVKHIMHGSVPTPAIKIDISPITTETTVEEVKKKAKEMASCFKKQKATWIPAMTLQDLRKIYMDMDNSLGINDFIGNYFYDQDAELFYESEEHYNKLHETTK